MNELDLVIENRQTWYWHSLSRDQLVYCIEEGGDDDSALPKHSEAIELLIRNFDDLESAEYLLEYGIRVSFTTPCSHSLVTKFIVRYVQSS